jgi:hypothetical protein
MRKALHMIVETHYDEPFLCVVEVVNGVLKGLVPDDKNKLKNSD